MSLSGTGIGLNYIYSLKFKTDFITSCTRSLVMKREDFDCSSLTFSIDLFSMQTPLDIFFYH